MVQALGNVNYNQNTRFTKKGNAYQKTNAAKWIGAGVGAGYGLAKNAKHIFKSKELLEEIKPIFNSLEESLKQILQSISTDDASIQEYLNSSEFKKLFDNIPKICLSSAIATSVIVTTLLGLIIGSIANKIANKIRANKADKNNIQPTTKESQITEQQTKNSNTEPEITPKGGFAAFQNATK